METLTKLYFIRHGDTAYPTDSLGRKLIYGQKAPLTEIGIRQIQTLASRLKEGGIQFSKLYTSPFVRARKTAEIIAQDLNVPVLIEREELADISGPHHVGLLWERAIKGDLPKFEDHETHEQVADRMMRFYNEIKITEAGNTVGVVSHGDAIRVLIYRLQNSMRLLPPIGELNTYDYLNKGEAWKLSLNNDGNLVEVSFIITREGRSPKRERED